MKTLSIIFFTFFVILKSFSSEDIIMKDIDCEEKIKTEINLSGLRLNDDDLETALYPFDKQNNQIIKIDLSHNFITSRGLEILGKKEYKKLTILNLSSNNIDNRLSEFLTEKNFPSLRSLDLSKNPEIDDEGLVKLASRPSSRESFPYITCFEDNFYESAILLPYLYTLNLKDNDRITKKAIKVISHGNYFNLHIIHNDSNLLASLPSQGSDLPTLNQERTPQEIQYKRRLIVGEADFSYTKALLEKYTRRHEGAQLGKFITTTELRSEQELEKDYPKIFLLNKAYLEDKESIIQFGINAKKIHRKYAGQRFKRIHFNFPYGGGSYHSGSTRELVYEFFLSASRLQCIGDRIHMALAYTSDDKSEISRISFYQGYVYDIRNASNYAGYQLFIKRESNEDACREFFGEDNYKRYRGYQHMRSDGSPYTGKGHEFIFIKTGLTTVIPNEEKRENFLFSSHKEQQETYLDILPDLQTDSDSSDYEDIDEDKEIGKTASWLKKYYDFQESIVLADLSQDLIEKDLSFQDQDSVDINSDFQSNYPWYYLREPGNPFVFYSANLEILKEISSHVNTAKRYILSQGWEVISEDYLTLKRVCPSCRLLERLENPIFFAKDNKLVLKSVRESKYLEAFYRSDQGQEALEEMHRQSIEEQIRMDDPFLEEQEEYYDYDFPFPEEQEEYHSF